MGKNAGALLWNRRQLTLQPGITTIDTGLQQVNKTFAAMSPGEPPLGLKVASPGPADGALPGSRVHVFPMSPIAAWLAVTHGEPFVDSNASNSTVKVTFNNFGESAVTINVLFWDPHSVVGPGNADPYGTPQPIEIEIILTHAMDVMTSAVASTKKVP